MNKIKNIAKGIVVLVAVFAVANLFVSEFFNVDFEDGGFLYSAALTIIAVYLYKKHAK